MGMGMMGGGGMMSGGGMMGGRMMGGGNAMMAVSVAMAHSSMAGMMGGGGMMGGNAAAQGFVNDQVSSVSSGMGINMMMGAGMMGGGMMQSTFSFDYGDKFNNQDIRDMKAQGFNSMQINRFIRQNKLGDTRAGNRFQNKFQDKKAMNTNACQNLQSQFDDLQVRFDQLNNSSSNSTTTNYNDNNDDSYDDYYGSGIDDYSYEEPYYEEPYYEEPMMETAQSSGTEQNNPFGNGSGTNINVGGGFTGLTGTGTGTGTATATGTGTGTGTWTGELIDTLIDDTGMTINTGTGTSGEPGHLDIVTTQEPHPTTGTMGGNGGGSTTNPSNFTGYQPFTLQNYTPLGTSVATNQQIYTSQGGQGFYGSPQVTPTNPFTGAAYDLDENGLPQYNLTYGGGATLPGQVLPVQQGQKAAKKKQGGSPLGGL